VHCCSRRSPQTTRRPGTLRPGCHMQRSFWPVGALAEAVPTANASWEAVPSALCSALWLRQAPAILWSQRGWRTRTRSHIGCLRIAEGRGRCTAWSSFGALQQLRTLSGTCTWAQVQGERHERGRRESAPGDERADPQAAPQAARLRHLPHTREDSAEAAHEHDLVPVYMRTAATRSRTSEKMTRGARRIWCEGPREQGAHHIEEESETGQRDIPPGAERRRIGRQLRSCG